MQYAFAGDYTGAWDCFGFCPRLLSDWWMDGNGNPVEAIEKAVMEVGKFDADDWFVIATFDVNFGCTPTLPSILYSPLLPSKSAHKTNFTKQLKEDVCLLFQKPPRYNRIHAVDYKPPFSPYRELTAGLMWCQSSLSMQLHFRHAQLNGHLHNIGATATPVFPVCNRREETVRHFLFSCIAHTKHRQSLINALWRDALNISKILSDPTCIPYTLNLCHTNSMIPTTNLISPLTPKKPINTISLEAGQSSSRACPEETKRVGKVT